MQSIRNVTTSVADPSLYRVEFSAMASACEIVIGATSQAEAMRCIELAVNEVHRIEKKYTRYQSDSIISIINSNAGKDWVKYDEETASLLNYADTLYKVSDGLFDITSGVLRRVWNFKEAKLPDATQLSTVLSLIGWTDVEHRDQSIKLPKVGMEIDFGGFGKEYATDRAASILASEGIHYGYVNLGGDLRAIGPKFNGEPWEMGIQNPNNRDAVIAMIPIKVGALATSGDYEKYFELDGKRYCHVMSPKTGQPVRFWKSVSILAPLSITAGSYSTIAMLKESDGIKWLEESDLAYFAIDYTGKIYQKQSNPIG